MNNRTIIQFFEWYLPSDAGHWKHTMLQAEKLKGLGITEVWLPPAYKCANGINDVGYGVYDMYDLGEFDQKGTVPTKYGTKDEYLSAVKALQQQGIKVYADVVFNHRMGADGTENVQAKVFDLNNRGHQLEQREITAWTKFDFVGRGGNYSDFKWNHNHFDGTDWDNATNKKALYLFEGKAWENEVDLENGNFDYLMGADLDLNYPETFDELVRWGKWYLDFTGVDGFRLDAIKHLSFSKMFSWITEMRDHAKKDLFIVGEYWHQALSALTHYLDKNANDLCLFDVPLHYNFYSASNSNGNFDMSKMFENSLVGKRPSRAVTIVDNHDTQPGQALQSYVNGWFKLHAYSLILLRQEGTPCVFYGDLYGIPHDGIAPLGQKFETLLKARQSLAYGEQIDYFNDSSVVGFTRMGDERHENSGVAVVMTDSVGGTIRMCVGERFIGKTMVDCINNNSAEIIVENDGCANFPVGDGSVSVYVDKQVFGSF